jgi:O-antigen ligase
LGTHATGPLFSRRETHHVRAGIDERSELPEGMSEIQLLALLIGMVTVAWAFPFQVMKYGLLAGFGIIFLVQSAQRPAMGLALLSFGVPAIDLVPPGLIPIRGLNAETLLALALFFIWHRANVLYGKSRYRTFVGSALGLYALLILVSCFNSWLTWRFSLFDLLSGAKNHLTYMLFLPVAFHAVRNRRDRVLLLGAASVSILLNCFQAINHSWYAFLAGSLERYRAMALLAIQPNILGSALAMYLPVFLTMAFNGVASRGARFFFWICSGSAAFALLLTLSRGSWLGLAFGMFVVAVYRSRKLLVLMLLLGATYQIWVPQQVIDRVAGTTADTQEEYVDPDQIADGSTQMRIEQYKSLPAMMQPRPILGWGYGSYPHVFERYGTLQRYKGAHSSYCQKGTEEGVIGLLVVAWVFVAQLAVAFRASQKLEDPMMKWMAIGLVGGVLAMVVCMASGARFETQKIFVFHWIFLGMVERELRIHEERESKSRGEPVLGLSKS